jgi:glycosyltransferase involved in cell wall biosynthesis
MDAVYPLGYQRGEWVASDQFALEARLRACRVDPRATLVAFVGTFGRSYDLGTVIEAAGRMTASADCDAQFVLCGRGERESEWRRAADGISRVAFLGWLPAGELAYLLARSAAGLAAYEPEAPQGIPNKIIEYLSAGLPILSTLSGETKSLLDSSGCGLYYPPRDAGALVGLVQDLLRDSVRRAAMGTAARALFDERFSALAVYGAMADHLEMLVRRIEDRGSSPGGSALQREPSRVRW